MKDNEKNENKSVLEDKTETSLNEIKSNQKKETDICEIEKNQVGQHLGDGPITDNKNNKFENIKEEFKSDKAVGKTIRKAQKKNKNFVFDVIDNSIEKNLELEEESEIKTVKKAKLFAIENVIDKKEIKKVTKNPKKIKFNSDDLVKLYEEVRDIKYIGRKRQPDEKLAEIDKSQIPAGKAENIKNMNESGDINKNIKPTSKPIRIEKNGIPNPFDPTLRLEAANKMNFIKSFTEDYAPIKMQKDNEKIFENIEKGDTVTKTHFIKKKQSAVSIKRQSGVSYVVATESKQLNVDSIYKPLGHLVYQGTHGVNHITDQSITDHINTVITSQLINSPILISVFESQDEDEMKNYLLRPDMRIKIAKE